MVPSRRAHGKNTGFKREATLHSRGNEKWTESGRIAPPSRIQLVPTPGQGHHQLQAKIVSTAFRVGTANPQRSLFLVRWVRSLISAS